MKVHSPDYLYSFEISNIDNQKLAGYCLKVEEFFTKIKKKSISGKKFNYPNITSSEHTKYNTFTFITEEILNLYTEIKKHVEPLIDKSEKYVIKSWINIFRDGQQLDWHNHCKPWNKMSWHGFYCVEVGDSYTEYKIHNEKDIIKISSKNGLFVFGKSDGGNKHRTSLWGDKQNPRITIGFDIVPVTTAMEDESLYYINQYLPFIL